MPSPLRTARRPITALAALALVAAGCGGGADDRRAPAAPGAGTQRPAPAPAATVEPGAEGVVRAWADTLRRGDVKGAARFFALPSVVANGTAPIRLRTRADARSFNRALPCGARVTRFEPSVHGFVVATFVLSERPGPGRCGSGAGGTASSAFRVKSGRITHWMRVPDAQAAEPGTLS